jgi:hypothetical protein
MDNFIIVLFKNKKKRKIIKGYKTEKKALEKFNKLIDENKVIFDVRFENSDPCNYELVLLSTKDNYQEPLFKTDELGRNKKVFISNNSEYTIKKVSDFKIEEYIFDVVQNKKISFNEFLTKYCPKENLKVISTLNNKIIVQNDDNFNLFSLKNLEESERFMCILESYFKSCSRLDALFVRDTDTVHRKWMYELLEKKGFDRKLLYRQTTTFSKRN